jgi:uncharacterized membrane protein
MTQMERLIGIVLTAGVVASSSCLAVGLSLWFAGVGAPAEALMQVGIIVLLCTPVARVVISIVEYVIVRDWTFAGLTAIILMELMASAAAALLFKRRI